MKSFLRAYVFGSLIPLVRISTGLLRSKFIAIFLGLVGVGALSQANQIQQLGVTLGSLGLAVGVINRSRKFAEDKAVQKQIFGTSFTVHCFMALVILVGGLLFRESLTRMIFGTLDYQVEFIIVLFSIPFYSLASGHLEGVLFGLDGYYFYIRATVIATLLGFLSYFPLVYFWGVTGGFVAFAISGVVLFFCFLVFALRENHFRDICSFGFDWSELKTLIRFSGVMLFTGCVGYSTLLWMRGQIVQRMGIDANGIAHMSMAMTSYYTPFLTNAMWGKFYPNVSREGDSRESMVQLSTMLRLTVVLATGIVVWIMLFQREIVLLAYTESFLPALDIIPYQLVGDFFYFAWFLFGVYFMGTDSLKAYLMGWLVFYVGYPSVTVLLLDRYQLLALPIGYGLVSFFLCVVAMGYFVFSRRFPYLLPTLLLFVVCSAVVSAQAWLTLGGASHWIRSVLPILMVLFSLGYLRRQRGSSISVDALEPA